MPTGYFEPTGVFRPDIPRWPYIQIGHWEPAYIVVPVVRFYCVRVVRFSDSGVHNVRSRYRAAMLCVCSACVPPLFRLCSAVIPPVLSLFCLCSACIIPFCSDFILSVFCLYPACAPPCIPSACSACVLSACSACALPVFSRIHLSDCRRYPVRTMSHTCVKSPSPVLHCRTVFWDGRRGGGEVFEEPVTSRCPPGAAAGAAVYRAE